MAKKETKQPGPAAVPAAPFTTRKIYNLLYDGDIYSGFDHTKYEQDLQGWGGHDEYFAARIKETEPKLIIEVGSWKGRSALAMADIVSDEHLDCEIVCVDTWLGATEFWKNHDDPKRYKGLALKHGYPSVYYQFLANVKHLGRQDIITPFPQSSINAVRLLRSNNVKADLIYIDGSHEYDDVKQDLEYYYDILRPGGVMFGDDYCQYWHGVIRAVDEFAGHRGLKLETERWENEEGAAPSDYWRIRRP